MREKGIFFDLTPTFYGNRLTKILEASIVMSPAFRARRATSDERNRQRYESLVQRVLKSGVKFAAGSDMCWFYPGKTRGEATANVFTSLRDAGMPPLEVIRAITTNAADMTGKQLDEMNDKFEDIEHEQFGEDGFEDAVKQISAIENSLGLADISQFTATPPQKA